LGSFLQNEVSMMIKSIFLVLFSAIILASCVPMPTPTPTEELMPTSQPSTNTGLTSTATVNMERWLEYQNALAAVFLPSTPGLCEWQILGQSKREVYVWAICQEADSPNGAAMSAPAVIYLSEGDTSIGKVEVPRDGSQYSIDIRKMFPQELQEKILSNSVDSLQEMWSHIQTRHKNPEPPLIVNSGISLP
jgi:hypothetical protein